MNRASRVAWMVALLGSAACGGSVNNEGEPATDSGSSGDGAAQEEAGDDGGQPGANPDLITIPLSSCAPTPAYTVGVSIGSQQFELSLDTGSTTLGVASTKCSNCGVSPEYSPGSTATDQHKTGQSQYGTGSWSGEIYKDTVTLGSSATAPVNLVAIDTQSQFFQPIQCNSKLGGMQGILGFGPPGAAVAGTNAYFEQLVATKQLPDVFATELCDSGGTLWLGGYDPAATTAAPQYVPMGTGIVSQIYYAANLISIGVGGATVAVASGQFSDSAVDTGTSLFVFAPTTYDTLTAAIQKAPGFSKVFGASFFPSSSQVTQTGPSCGAQGQSKASLDAALPALTLNLGGGVTFQVPATESYLIPYSTGWCSSLFVEPYLDTPNLPLASIMGVPVLRSSVVIFDRAQKRIGFAPHQACP